MATIALDAPCEGADVHFRRGEPQRESLLALCDRLRFGPLTRRRIHAACGLEFMPAASANV